MKTPRYALLLLPIWLGGCALLHDLGLKTDAMEKAESRIAPQWQAPLPHDGKLTQLHDWWAQFNDPLLLDLIDAAQRVSPNLASTRARMEGARASAVAAGAVLIPKLDINASATRGQSDVRFPEGTSSSRTLNASWEIDLFGAASAASDAADARLKGAQAEWHAARVSVAAEVANLYVGLRACEAQLAQSRVDARSRAETARLSEINREAGFESPANAALARASAAQANGNLTLQRTQCDLQIKALVALTALDEPQLRQKLTAVTAGTIPQPAHIQVSEVPAAALAQRPDLFSAAQSVLAANADVSQLQAQRLPRITLNGSVGKGRFESDTSNISGSTWSWGPLSVVLPIFDGGTRRANVDAGRARYDEAVSQYAAKLRTAVREVEEALVNLDSTAAREADAHTALKGYTLSFEAVSARHRHGMANQFELEDARRSMIGAQTALINLQRDRVTAWISLYRALGGGWDTQSLAVPPTVAANNQ